jgi:hypothetical protein
MKFTAAERKRQNELNMTGPRIHSIQEATPIFTFENSFTPENPLTFRTRSYLKTWEDDHFCNMGYMNVPSDFKDNKLMALKFLATLPQLANTKVYRFPQKQKLPKGLTRRDRKISRIIESIERGDSTNKIAKAVGRSWTFVNSVREELSMTGTVTMYDYQNPYGIDSESIHWAKEYFDIKAHTGNSTHDLVKDYGVRFPGKKILVKTARLVVKSAGFRFYRSTWVQKEKYKAPPT